MKIGIQLYSVRNSFAEDRFGTLKKLSDTGYHYVEAANHNAAVDDGVGFGFPAKELKKNLADLGLSIVAISTHCDLTVCPLSLTITRNSATSRSAATRNSSR